MPTHKFSHPIGWLFFYSLKGMLKMCRTLRYEQTSPLDVPLYAFGFGLSILRIFSYPLVLCLKCADHFLMYKHHHSAYLSFAVNSVLRTDEILLRNMKYRLCRCEIFASQMLRVLRTAIKNNPSVKIKDFD